MLPITWLFTLFLRFILGIASSGSLLLVMKNVELDVLLLTLLTYFLLTTIVLFLIMGI